MEDSRSLGVLEDLDMVPQDIRRSTNVPVHRIYCLYDVYLPSLFSFKLHEWRGAKPYFADSVSSGCPVKTCIFLQSSEIIEN